MAGPMKKINPMMIFKDIKKTLWISPYLLSFGSILLIFYDIGFNQTLIRTKYLILVYILTLLSGTIFLATKYASSSAQPKKMVWPYDLLFIVLTSILVVNYLNEGLFMIKKHEIWGYLALVYNFIRVYSTLRFKIDLNPAQTFLATFLALILTGTFLLMLPNSTYEGISIVDALFTSTSAVCVTGLIVVDTGSHFTQMGQTIILILIQLGGLGIMTFTSYFSFFFRGSSSYESQLILKDITNTKKLGEVFNTLKKIIFFTILIEAVGAIIIYSTIDNSLEGSIAEQVYFSIFHSISGFCNAGFSTLSNSLYEYGFRFNYPLHLTIAGLFIIGGIGFPIVFNFLIYIRYYFVNRIFKRKRIYRPWVININTRIVLNTTGILLVLGTLVFYVFEYNNTLAEHSGAGKIATAFFSAATPRTAGFNTIDTSMVHNYTLLFLLFLMWVGASPNSTGGGIKTSSLALAFLNVVSIAKGKDRIELFKREIANSSLTRASSVILLSIITIGISTILLTFFEENKELPSIIFETISAFGTVGLSLGITSNLSTASKIVITITMFVGRVSMLTILVAFLRKIKYLQYKYPAEDIIIN